MSLFAKNIALHSPTRRTKTGSWQFFQTNVVWLNVVTFGVVLALCLVYIFQVNGAISKGYQIRDIETSIRELTLLNQRVELQTQQAQSLENVARAVTMLGFVDAELPNYVKSDAPAYALAQ